MTKEAPATALTLSDLEHILTQQRMAEVRERKRFADKLDEVGQAGLFAATAEHNLAMRKIAADTQKKLAAAKNPAEPAFDFPAPPAKAAPVKAAASKAKAKPAKKAAKKPAKPAAKPVKKAAKKKPRR